MTIEFPYYGINYDNFIMIIKGTPTKQVKTYSSCILEQLRSYILNCKSVIVRSLQLWMILIDVNIKCTLVLVSVFANRADERNVGVNVLFADVSPHATLGGHKLVAGDAQIPAGGLHYL